MILARPFLLLASSLLLSISSVEAVWPKPALMTQGNSTLLVDTSNLEIQLPQSASEDLKAAVLRTQQAIRKDSMRPLIVGRGSDKVAERLKSPHTLKKLKIVIEDDDSSSKERRGLVIGQTNYDLSEMIIKRETDSIRSESLKKVQDKDESYSINLPENGQDATITAKNALGAFRGLTTFEQLLWALNKDDVKMKYIEAPVSIVDKPSFPYRGLSEFWKGLLPSFEHRPHD